MKQFLAAPYMLFLVLCISFTITIGMLNQNRDCSGLKCISLKMDDWKQRTAQEKLLLKKCLNKIQSNNYKGALEYINQILEANRSCGFYFALRGEIYENAGNSDKACEDYHKASSLGTNVERQLKGCE